MTWSHPRYKVRERKPEKTSANKAMSNLLDKLGFDPAKFALFEIWDRESKRVVSGSRAVAVQGSRLCVEVPSAIHRQELMYSKGRLIKKINQAMGRKAVTDIRFEFGSSPSKALNRGGPLRAKGSSGQRHG